MRVVGLRVLIWGTGVCSYIPELCQRRGWYLWCWALGAGSEGSCEGVTPLPTGEHRGLGAGISKVRSLKMDRKVWTETLIEVRMPLLTIIA